MIYRMNEKQYNELKRTIDFKTKRTTTHEDIVNYVNDNLRYPNIKQSHLTAKDDFGSINIQVDPIRIITDVITYK